MIDKRLMKLLKEGKKYIFANVFLQWICLLCNLLAMYGIAMVLSGLKLGISGGYLPLFAFMVFSGAMVIRYFCMRLNHKMAFLSSREVKKTLRKQIYEKLLRQGPGYAENVKQAEILQTAIEGVDQLEVYYGSYLPQFFYAMLAPVTLFLVLLFIDVKAAIILLVFVPLIPVSIIFVQRWAKKLLSKYWNQYTDMGDSFLDNLRGLTTLKVYEADERQNLRMNEQAEAFRIATMRVLIMQLNSISIMDLVAYAGAAFGIIAAIIDLKNGTVSLSGCIFILLISVDFFLPMRQLGSYFHTAMNGMAASDKIFSFLETPEKKNGTISQLHHKSIHADHLSFSYGDHKVLDDLCFTIPEHGFVGIAGVSGSGKSTLASILTMRHTAYEGTVLADDIDLRNIHHDTWSETVTYVQTGSYLFKGTVKENLLYADDTADDEKMWEVLEEAAVADDLRAREGLNTMIEEQASNFSMGQRQRIAIARALLKDSDIYIFDEATSGIDMESEQMILETIGRLKGKKTIIFISHRLANLKKTDFILVLENGRIAEQGTHADLLKNNGVYASMYNQQIALENYGKEADDETLTNESDV